MRESGTKASTTENSDVRWVECYQALKKAIVDRVYPPGTKLVERRVSTELGVSRSSLRTALHHLAAEGLVELRPGEGAYVTRISPEDAVQLLDVREALEGMAAYRAAERATESQIAELKELERQMETALEGQIYLTYLDLTRAFHAKMMEASGNDHLAIAIEAARVKLIQYGTDILLSGRVWELFKGHEEILKAMEARSPQKAEQAAREHIGVIRELLSDIYTRET